MKTCKNCNEAKPESEFWAPPSFNGRLFSTCKQCSNVSAMKWQKDNPDKMKVTNERWKLKNPERMRVIKTAGSAVHRAVRDGRLVRASACEQCGKSDCRIEAAHIDYRVPLIVRWLCRSCHVKYDIQNPKSL